MVQVVLMLLLATNYIPVVVNHLLMAFYTSKVSFNCRVGDDGVARKINSGGLGHVLRIKMLV